jgi:hypothetical protein
LQPGDIVAIATGTTGLTAFLIYVVRALWIEHQRNDADVRTQRDIAIAGWRDQTAATKNLADVVEKQTRADARRKP